VKINAETKITDGDGQFTAALDSSTLYTVATGLEAISFDPLFETGRALAARKPVKIEAKRLITPADAPCRILIDGVPYVHFSSINSTVSLLTIPLADAPLNQIFSATGAPTPAENYPPGPSGFSIPESHFRSGTTLVGVWRFLGRESAVTPDMLVCKDRLIPSQCNALDPKVLRGPFEHTRLTISKLTNLALAAARAGIWKGEEGRYTVPFLRRGATILSYMERALQNSTGQNFKCEVIPMSCSLQQVPKKQLMKAFAQLFAGRRPRGLAAIYKRSKREQAAFARIVKKLPPSYVRCE
jgi:hypothetical protein